MKIQIYKYLTIIVVSYFLLVHSIFADSPAIPDAYIKITTNKEFALAMIPRNGFNFTGIEQSGLYKTSDLKKPIWTIDWYTFGVISNLDGRYLIRFGPWASSAKHEALSFFENGKLVKSYIIEDLVRDQSKLARIC